MRKKAKKAGLIGRLNVVESKESRMRLWRNGAALDWHLPDEVSLYPLDPATFDGSLDQLIREHVLPGHLPEGPLLDETDSVITLGSCFARELRNFLTASGVEATRFWIPSGLNNTFAILDFVSWCATGAETRRGFRYERAEGGDIREWTPEAERQDYADAFARAGAFVFTIGLAEVWQDRDTGGVFWRGVPDEIFDASRHVFRLTTVGENADNLAQIVTLVRRMNPAAPVVFTLSPVPLRASFRGISCMTADCVSKSVLRVALDQVMSDKIARVYYWPSFEIVKWVGAHLPWAACGRDGNSRDINRRLVSAIVEAFVDSFYTPEAVTAIRARAAT